MMGRMIEIWIVISPHRQTPQKTHVSRGGGTRRRGGSAVAAIAAAEQASQASSDYASSMLQQFDYSDEGCEPIECQKLNLNSFARRRNTVAAVAHACSDDGTHVGPCRVQAVLEGLI